MLKKINEAIVSHSLLNENDNVIIGFSGGADSSFLTYALKQLNYNVIAVHVHHGIRGDEADRDAEFVKNFCKKYNIPFYIEKIDVPNIAKEKKLSIETAARQERYKIFDKYAKKYNARIATAHNKNDQAETVLMHLLRGSGLNGLCGMKYKNGNIIRPMLDISRFEIEKYNSSNSIQYITDSTNLSAEYSRNKIRLDIFPKLYELSSSNPVESIVQCSEILNEYAEYFGKIIDEYSQKLLVQKNNHVYLSICELPHIVQIELIRRSISYLIGNIVDIERIHLEDVYSLLKKNSGKVIHLPHQVRVKRVYDTLLFYFEEDTVLIEYPFELNMQYKWLDGTVSSEKAFELEKQKNCEYVDAEKLPNELVIRTRKNGDFIHPLGSAGRCTLKKYFIDKKIPVDIRSEIPLLAHGSEIFAIIGYTVSEKAKVTPSTRNIIKIFRES